MSKFHFMILISQFLRAIFRVANYFWESLYTSFYKLFFSYMLYNSKWSNIFQACSQLDFKNKSKELQPFWTFFHNDLMLWSAAVWFLQGQKNDFITSNANILQSVGRNFFKLFLHLFKPMHYKIPLLHVSENVFFGKIWNLY